MGDEKYHGPYFRTGIDGAGCNWELSDDPSTDDPSTRLARRPSTWELQKPKLYLKEGQTKKSVKINSNEAVSDEKSENKPMEVLVSKDYLKEMLMEIWKETIQEEELPKPQIKVKSRQVISITEVKRAKSEDKVQVAEKPSVLVPIPKRTMTSIEERARIFDSFNRMSLDPPETPPPSPPRQKLSSGSSLGSPIPGLKKKKILKKVKKLVKKSKSHLQLPKMSHGYPSTPRPTSYYESSTFATGSNQNSPIYRRATNGRWFQIAATANNTRVSQGNDLLSSTLVVSKINAQPQGWMNSRDAMQPPSFPLPPEKPKKKVIKKQDAFARPLSHNSNWFQGPTDFVVDPHRGIVRSLPSSPAPELQNHFVRGKTLEQEQQAQLKSQQLELMKKLEQHQPLHQPQLYEMMESPKAKKKPVHPFKQFPEHVPGPKRHPLNMYVSPYVSEIDIKSKSKDRALTYHQVTKSISKSKGF